MKIIRALAGETQNETAKRALDLGAEYFVHNEKVYQIKLSVTELLISKVFREWIVEGTSMFSTIELS